MTSIKAFVSRRFLSIGLVIAIALAIPLVVLADNVVNNIDTTVDTALETRTITAGGSTLVGYWIQPLNDDASGCNATGANPATVNLSVPAGVTASSSSVTLTGCGSATAVSVTFSSSTPGSYTINVSNVTGGKSGSQWNLGTAAWTLNVNPPPDTTPPVISYTVNGVYPAAPDGSNGWYVSDVTVDWTVTDPESSFTTTGCVDTTISADTAGTTLTCSASSAGGSSGPVSVTIKRDATAPSISGSRTPAANSFGWNNTDVSVSFSCLDSTSGVASVSSPTTLSSEGAGQSVLGTCTDNAGNSASATVSGINIDKTAPTASASASPAANGNGWNNTDVTVSFSGTDGLSGIDSCDADVVLSSEGANQSASGTCTDKAGNVSAPASVTGINIDKTDPTVSLVGGPTDGDSYYFGFVPAAPTCSASDALSGLDGSCSVSGYGNTVGNHTVSASATDKAGNSAIDSATYTVLAWTLRGFYQPVDMNGVVNTVKSGSTVPFKFEIFAGSLELTDPSLVTMSAVKTTCAVGSSEDAIEMTTTGSTVLRYDTVSGQFIYNWKTPNTPNLCYKVTMTAQDGSKLEAYFKLR